MRSRVLQWYVPLAGLYRIRLTGIGMFKRHCLCSSLQLRNSKSPTNSTKKIRDRQFSASRPPTYLLRTIFAENQLPPANSLHATNDVHSLVLAEHFRRLTKSKNVRQPKIQTKQANKARFPRISTCLSIERKKHQSLLASYH